MRLPTLCYAITAFFAREIDAFEIQKSSSAGCGKYSQLARLPASRNGNGYYSHRHDRDRAPLNLGGGRRSFPRATAASPLMHAMQRGTTASSSSQLSMMQNDKNQQQQQQQQPSKQQTNNEEENLNKFRSLMGTLYGIAGMAHFYDCFLGPSALLTAAGNLPFHELPVEGQALATLWCLSGPLTFLLTRQQVGGGALADVGLVGYGVVEVVAAAFSPDVGTVANAGLVQVVVLVSWLYSRQKTVVE